VTAGIDLTAKLALVTGVNSGRRFETLRVLALRGAPVIGTARTLAKAGAACAQVCLAGSSRSSVSSRARTRFALARTRSRRSSAVLRKRAA